MTTTTIVFLSIALIVLITFGAFSLWLMINQANESDPEIEEMIENLKEMKIKQDIEINRRKNN